MVISLQSAWEGPWWDGADEYLGCLDTKSGSCVWALFIESDYEFLGLG